jgi:hypothetical protein
MSMAARFDAITKRVPGVNSSSLVFAVRLLTFVTATAAFRRRWWWRIFKPTAL